MTLSSESKQTLLSEYATKSEERVIDVIKKKKDGKINGDNLDLRVTTNDIRMSNSSKDYHFFASDWTPFRVTPQDFVANMYLQERLCTTNKNISVECFLPTADEINVYRGSLSMLVGRVLADAYPAFRWMSGVVPDHLSHSLSDVMARRSMSFELPILLKNEAKYEDCIAIMDSYVQLMKDFYQKADRGSSLPFCDSDSIAFVVIVLLVNCM